MPAKRKVPPAWLMEREWPDGSREATAKVAWQRRLDGLSNKAIAAELDVREKAVSDLIGDPTGQRLRERHHKRRGTCSDCGADTFNGGGVPPERCRACAAAREREKGEATKRHVAERVREWTRVHGQPPRIQDWSPAHAAVGYLGGGRRGSDYEGNAEAVAAAERNRAEGWPAVSTVIYHWGHPEGTSWQQRHSGEKGSWDLALEQIGVGAFQYAQRRKDIDPAEVVRLYVDERLSSLEVARRLGIEPGTVRWHLQRRGVAMRPPAPPADRARILRLYATGAMSQAEVAAEVGCALCTVNRVVVAAGIGPGKGWRGPRRPQRRAVAA